MTGTGAWPAALDSLSLLLRCLLLCSPWGGQSVAADIAQAPGAALEAQTIAEIRSSCLPASAGGEEHPLPLAASWNEGSVVTGFGPPYQVSQIQHGRFLLP